MNEETEITAGEAEKLEERPSTEVAESQAEAEASVEPAFEEQATPIADEDPDSLEQDVAGPVSEASAPIADDDPDTQKDTPTQEQPVRSGEDDDVPPDAQMTLTDEVTQTDAEVLELLSQESTNTASETEEARKLAVLEAIVYVTDEPLTTQQIAAAMNEPVPEIQKLLDKLVEEFNRPEHGLSVREVAGGYKITTKAEHHEAVRTFVKNLNPPLKLSLAALETLAVIAYKQPITAPEIMEIRGVQGAGVLKTLLDRKLITSSGRKQVVGKPMLYKTTKEFLIQFGLKDLTELPSLKEFDELRRLAFSDADEGQPVESPDFGAGDAQDTAADTPETAESSEERSDNSTQDQAE